MTKVKDLCCYNCGSEFDQAPNVRFVTWPDIRSVTTFDCQKCRSRATVISDKIPIDEPAPHEAQPLETFQSLIFPAQVTMTLFCTVIFLMLVLSGAAAE